MLANVCAYTVPSLSSWTHLVLSCALDIFIPTSQRAKCAQSCLHEYAHIGAIMPACICTTCYYVCVLTSAIVPARACSILDTITSMCVGAHDCDPAHVHNAHVSAIMPTRACTRRNNHSLTCMYTWAQSFSQVCAQYPIQSSNICPLVFVQQLQLVWPQEDLQVSIC
jgi:hypothetical protein